MFIKINLSFSTIYFVVSTTKTILNPLRFTIGRDKYVNSSVFYLYKKIKMYYLSESYHINLGKYINCRCLKNRRDLFKISTLDTIMTLLKKKVINIVRRSIFFLIIYDERRKRK